MRKTDAFMVFSLVILFVALSKSSQAQSCDTSMPYASPITSGDGLRYPLAIGPISWSVMGGRVQPVRGSDDLVHVAYSLLLTNSWNMPATIRAFEALQMPGQVASSNKVVAITGEEVTGHIRWLSVPQTNTAKDFVSTLAAGQTAIAYFDLTFKSYEDVAKGISHRMEAEVPQPVLGQTLMKVESATVPVSCERPVRISSPLRGDGWLNGNECCEELGPHRLVMNSINGSLNPTEAFAVDWIRLDKAGKAYHDDPKKPENWYGYGAEVVSVAEGEVVEVVRDLKDAVPGRNPDGLTLSAIAGNRVIVRIGENQFAEFDHLAPGSITVHVGEKVKRGQLLGHLGNTGNSDSPHLHFQLMNRPSTLDGYALPYVIDHMELEGRVAMTLQQIDDLTMRGEALPVSKVQHKLEDRMPLSRDVIAF